MKITAIILSGGFSSRFGTDKGLLKIANRSLIMYVTEIASLITDEIFIVTNSNRKIELYSKEVKNLKIKYFLDLYNDIGPLAGIYTGLINSKKEYSLIIPFDTPFLSKKILFLLIKLCEDKNAIIPRWPNGHIEPLHAVYKTKIAFTAAKDAIANKEKKVSAMIQRIDDVCYISTNSLRKYDPTLQTFLNINTPLDLEKAKNLMK
ncbi:MAG: hypothetical protein AC479_02395 [miscellaneous Crenarchaeota group-6 archaeon AD8-1]|nr:MAG: hypothetical protein AC479_02395 [miscellaneous Crenarchaeota group-6 archaeon AD8-1]